jgi:hypothetical protein
VNHSFFRLVEIKEATEQVVAGMKYVIKCVVKVGSDHIPAEFEIWESKFIVHYNVLF